MNLFVTVVVKTARCISALDKLIKTEFSFCVCFVLHGYIDCIMMKCKYILYIVRFFRVLVCFCCMLLHARCTSLLASSTRKLRSCAAQFLRVFDLFADPCNFCRTTCNFCAISCAYVQFGLALLRPSIIFDRLSTPKIDRLTGKLQSSLCL